MYACRTPVPYHPSGPLIYLWFESVLGPLSFLIYALVLRQPLLLQSGCRMKLIRLHNHVISRSTPLLHPWMKRRLRFLVNFVLVPLLSFIVHSVFAVETQVLEFVVDQRYVPVAEIELFAIDQVFNDGKLLHYMCFCVNTALNLPKILVEKAFVNILCIFLMSAQIQDGACYFEEVPLNVDVIVVL